MFIPTYQRLTLFLFVRNIHLPLCMTSAVEAGLLEIETSVWINLSEFCLVHGTLPVDFIYLILFNSFI